MSPEQATGYEVGQPSDIFSLGAVLAFAATGEGPFGAGTTAALLYRVVHGSPSLDQVPAEVRPLIERCLAKDPGQRPTAAGLLAEVGVLQPTPNWLPESIIRAFARDPAAGPAPATAGMGLGSNPAIAFGEAATRTTAANSAAQAASGESLLLAPAGAPPAMRRPPPRGACRCLPGARCLPGVRIVSPRQPEGTGHGAAGGGRWRWRGSPASWSRHL